MRNSRVSEISLAAFFAALCMSTSAFAAVDSVKEFSREIIVTPSAPLNNAPVVSESGFWATGFEQPGFNRGVLAMTEYDNKIIIGGFIVSAGGVRVNNIAIWDGTDFSSFGTGTNQQVQELLIYNGNLIASGRFTVIDGVPVNGMASWDGVQWRSLENTFNAKFIKGIVVHNGLLVVAANLTHEDINGFVAAWDGTSWTQLGGSLDGEVGAIAIHNESLLVGGTLSSAGETPLNNFAYWTGSAWVALGDSSNEPITELGSYQGNIIAANNQLSTLKQWDGTSWSLIPHGLPDGQILDFLEYEGKFAVSARASDILASWDGTTWSVLKQDFGDGRRIEFIKGKLTHGGTANVAQGFVEAFDGTTWKRFQKTGEGVNGWVSAETIYDEKLIVGGHFTYTGLQETKFVGAWNGSNWETLGHGLGKAALALKNYGGDLYAGGNPPILGSAGQPTGLARWDGVSWTEVEGVDVTIGALGVFMDKLIIGQLYGSSLWSWDGVALNLIEDGIASGINSIFEYDSALIIGGDFRKINEVPIRKLAQLKNGVWSDIGNSAELGLDEIYVITTFEGDLVIGGRAKSAGAIFRLTGSEWVEIVGGMNFPFSVRSLATYDNHLYAGTAGNLPDLTIDHIAKWNGSCWSGLGTGADDAILALQVFQGSLYTGGRFNAVGGQIASQISSWTSSGSCCETPGDANSDGRYNIADVTFLINHIFSGGSPQCCHDQSDANGDNRTNISDVTYSIQNIFASGPNPVCGATGL